MVKSEKEKAVFSVGCNRILRRTAAVIWVQANMVKFEKNKRSCEFLTTWNWNAEMPASDISQAQSPNSGRKLNLPKISWAVTCFASGPALISKVLPGPRPSGSSAIPSGGQQQYITKKQSLWVPSNSGCSMILWSFHFRRKNSLVKKQLSHWSAEITTLSQYTWILPLPSA